MSLSAIAKDAKTSQREFSIIVERQQELEKQLVQVMKSLDTAKDMLIRERQEKLSLKEQLKGRDEELVDMQRKYLELQKAMGNLRETNNKYHEKVTKLQIENEQLRKGMKDRNNLQLELTEKSNELTRLKETFKRQDLQMRNQEEQIVQKLSMIEKVINEHKGLVDGQEKLNKVIAQQSNDIAQLSDEKAETQTQMAAQQRQLNFQHAQIVMLQEQMHRLESQMTGGGSPSIETPIPNTPSTDNRGSRYIASLAKGISMKPFNASGKAENSKNSYWRSDPAGKKHK